MVQMFLTDWGTSRKRVAATLEQAQGLFMQTATLRKGMEAIAYNRPFVPVALA